MILTCFIMLRLKSTMSLGHLIATLIAAPMATSQSNTHPVPPASSDISSLRPSMPALPQTPGHRAPPPATLHTAHCRPESLSPACPPSLFSASPPAAAPSRSSDRRTQTAPVAQPSGPALAHNRTPHPTSPTGL